MNHCQCVDPNPSTCAICKTAACSEANPCDNVNHNHTGYRNTDDAFISVESYLLTKLPTIRARIAELRGQRCHVTAAIMRDEMLSQIEAWLDPEGAAICASMQVEQGKQAGRMAREIDPVCGF
jgi:hypothetical protein